MIYTFQKVNIKALKLLLNGRFQSFFSYLNLRFLLVLMGGSIFSYFSVSILLDYLLLYYESYVWSTFFGMIIGSVLYISRDVQKWNAQTVALLLLGTLIGASLSYLPPATENPNLWFVFFCGLIGVSGMTIPGLSGSFILMLLGNYVLLLVDSVAVVYKVLQGVFSGDFTVFEIAENVFYIKIAFVFFVGSVFGMVSLSHVLGYVLKRWHQIVTTLIIGFIAGSLGMVWPWKTKHLAMDTSTGKLIMSNTGNPIVENYERFLPNFQQWTDVWMLLFILLGVAIVLAVGRVEAIRKG